jgi:hypothetical protein
MALRVKMRTIEKTKAGEYILGEFANDVWQKWHFKTLELLSDFILKKYGEEYEDK